MNFESFKRLVRDATVARLRGQMELALRLDAQIDRYIANAAPIKVRLYLEDLEGQEREGITAIWQSLKGETEGK